MFHINTQNAQAKLLKYKRKNISPVLFAACVLIPWRKWSYFEEYMTADELVGARRLVQELWSSGYAEKPIITVGVEVQSGSEVSKAPPKKASVLQEHIRRRRNPQRESVLDEYARYCLLDVVEELEGGSYLLWWSIHEVEFPRLAQVARDIFGIPGMSAEVERLISSAKLMIPPHRSALEPASIEAGECIRNWVKGGLLCDDYLDYLSTEKRQDEHFRKQSSAPIG